MNKIEGLLCLFGKNKYELEGEFTNYRIDGYWLDEELDKFYPNHEIDMLVPSLLYRFEDKNEAEMVRKNILPKENETTICPILVCNQGCGLRCVYVVAEIRNDGNCIKWERLGLHKRDTIEVIDKENNSAMPSIMWLDKVKQMTFEMDDYLKMIEAFNSPE
jgi:hypothetical protein